MRLTFPPCCLNDSLLSVRTEDGSPASRCPRTHVVGPLLSLPSFLCPQGSQSALLSPDPVGLEGAVPVALGDGIARSPACGVPVVCFAVWVTQRIAFLQRGIWSSVCSELCSRMVPPLLLGLTRVCSPSPLKACCLVARRNAKAPCEEGMALLVFSAPVSMTMATCRLELRDI